MRIALVDATVKPTNYPVALLKLGAWRREQGDEVRLYMKSLPEPGEADQIWVSSVFTYDTPYTVGLVREAQRRAKVVKVGGIAPSLLPRYYEALGAEVHRGLVPEAEEVTPAYDLLDKLPAYTVTHASRGCCRACGFCMVSRLEPEFHDRSRWLADLVPGAREVIFYDNNWLAKPYASLARDVAAIKHLHDAGTIVSVDFNQALDARLMTEKLADLLEGVPIRPVRFAFDNMATDGYYQQAVRWMAERGHTQFMALVLYNYLDTPADFYYRLRVTVELCAEYQVSIASFPMPFQPILEVDARRAYVGRNWTPQQKRGFGIIRSAHSGPSGGVTPKSKSFMANLEEFEFWFGATPEEFLHRISYPKVKEWAARKKGELREKRLAAKGRVLA